MKVFAATAATQGQRETDFTWTVDGELVMVSFECDADLRDPDGIDGGCGCRRSMTGLTSQKATTTFTVIDLDVDRDGFASLVESTLRDAGWSDAVIDAAPEIAGELVEYASGFDVGDVLERRGDEIQRRTG